MTKKKPLHRSTSAIKPESSHSPKNSQPHLITEEIKIASPITRVIAIVYDGMLILALLFLVGAVLGVVGTLLLLPVGSSAQEAQKLPAWYQNLVMTPAFILTLVGFYGIFWRRAGQTLGMQTWRLKTVNDDGSLLTWKQTFKRILSACIFPACCAVMGWLVYPSRGALLFSLMFGFIFNYVFCLLNRRGLAVHDMLSQTITLKMPKIHHESLWQSFKNRKKS